MKSSYKSCWMYQWYNGDWVVWFEYMSGNVYRKKFKNEFSALTFKQWIEYKISY